MGFARHLFGQALPAILLQLFYFSCNSNFTDFDHKCRKKSLEFRLQHLKKHPIGHRLRFSIEQFRNSNIFIIIYSKWRIKTYELRLELCRFSFKNQQFSCAFHESNYKKSSDSRSRFGIRKLKTVPDKKN